LLNRERDVYFHVDRGEKTLGENSDGTEVLSDADGKTTGIQREKRKSSQELQKKKFLQTSEGGLGGIANGREEGGDK